MNTFKLPDIPINYHLKKAFLSTFDLDENILKELIDINDIDKYLIVRGDGEYISLDDNNSPIKDRIVNVFYELTNKKLKNNKYQAEKYYHAKIWLFIYENDEKNIISKLIIQSKNIYPYDSIETSINLIGHKVDNVCEKNTPLINYFNALLGFTIDDEKIEFIKYLIDVIKYQSFILEDNQYEADDFEIITPYCKDISLLKDEYDEVLVISPFINVDNINQLLNKKKENGRCVVISIDKTIESLIISDVKDVNYITSNISDKYIHAKIYLVRKDNIWDLYLGSMNLSDFSINKNVEAMIHLKNVKNITSIESFLKRYIDINIDEEIYQYNHSLENKDYSPVFNDTLNIYTRIRYIKKLLINQKHDEEYMNQITRYLLSSKCVNDLNDLYKYKKEIIPVRHMVITNNNKKRYVYRLSFNDNTLLGLINFSLHQYDYLFSQNVYLHILDRSIDNAFIKLHQYKDLKDLYIFKTDIHNFDPSINKDILSSQMDKLFHFDTKLCQFIKSIINESRYYLEGDNNIYKDDIIHQTGLPLGGFFENVYLYDVDNILDKAPLYLRCGDDILIGSKDKNEIEKYKNIVIDLLNKKKLTISENKTSISGPGEQVSYLGWNIINGEIDFTDSTINSIQKTIKKKTKDMLIMYGKRKIPNALRLPSIVKYVSHYQKSEYFISFYKRITTTEGLKKIDKMIMDLIRTVVSGKTGNSKYKIKYETIQAFGYRSLVNQYYDYINKIK